MLETLQKKFDRDAAELDALKDRHNKQESRLESEASPQRVSGVSSTSSTKGDSRAASPGLRRNQGTTPNSRGGDSKSNRTSLKVTTKGPRAGDAGSDAADTMSNMPAFARQERDLAQSPTTPQSALRKLTFK